MKRLILFSLIALTAFGASAQSSFTGTTSNSTRAIVNTGIDTSTYAIPVNVSHITIQPVITKNSGTVSTTSIMYYSVYGRTGPWVATGDTLTGTNQATNTTIWEKVSSARYWQIRTTGSGTMNATANHKISYK